VSTSVAWMDGRSDDVRRPAAGAGEGRGAARCVAYEARGYKQAWQTDRRADMQADGPNRARMACSAILGRNYNTCVL